MGIYDKTRCGVLSEYDKDFVETAIQLDAIREIIADTGYAYDPLQRIFYSTSNPWQRGLGYHSLYDEASAPLGMVFDCEPVRFNYAGKKWLIELWKGQYGITTGAEIGVYTTTGPDLEVPGVFDGTFYNCADDADHLSMTYTLLRNNEVMFSRAARHWWLTGFRLGEFAEPSALTMEVSITFKDVVMRDAFLAKLHEIGYSEKDVRYGSNTVLILFDKPHSRQPVTHSGIIGDLALKRVKGYVEMYRDVAGDLDNMFDIMMALKDKSPLLFNQVQTMGRQKELFEMHDTILKYFI